MQCTLRLPCMASADAIVHLVAEGRRLQRNVQQGLLFCLAFHLMLAAAYVLALLLNVPVDILPAGTVMWMGLVVVPAFAIAMQWSEAEAVEMSPKRMPRLRPGEFGWEKRKALESPARMVGFVHACVRACVRTCACVRTWVHMRLLRVQVYKGVYTCVCVCMYVRTRVCVCVCVCAFVGARRSHGGVDGLWWRFSDVHRYFFARAFPTAVFAVCIFAAVLVQSPTPVTNSNTTATALMDGNDAALDLVLWSRSSVSSAGGDSVWEWNPRSCVLAQNMAALVFALAAVRLSLNSIHRNQSIFAGCKNARTAEVRACALVRPRASSCVLVRPRAALRACELACLLACMRTCVLCDRFPFG